MCESIITLIGVILSGLIALFTALASVKRTDFYHRASILRTEFRNIITILEESYPEGTAPIETIRNPEIDKLIDDILYVFPAFKRNAFIQAWEDYRYDKKYGEMTYPREYINQPTKNVKKIIVPKIIHLISLLN